MPTLTYSTYTSEQDTQPEQVTEPLEEFIRSLSAHEVRTTKLGAPAFSFARIEGTRANANVRGLSALAYDVDTITQVTLAEMMTRLVDSHFAWAMYSTHSATYDLPKCRVILFFDREVTPDEYHRLWQIVRDEFDIPADTATRDPARLFFWPSVAPGGQPFFYCSSHNASLLPVDKLLTRKPSMFQGANAVGRPIQAPKTFGDFPKQLGKMFARQPQELWIPAVLGSYPLAPNGERDSTLHRVVASLVFRWPEVSDDWFRRLLRGSIAAMSAPEGVDHWLAILDTKLERARQRQEQETAKRIQDVAPAQEGRFLRDGKGNLQKVGANVAAFFSHSSTFAGVFRFNEFNQTIEIAGQPWKGMTSEWEPLTDDAIFAIKNWLAEHELAVSTTEVFEQISLTASENKVHPLRDYLNGLQWDGAQRLEGFLSRYYGTPDDQYHREVGKRFLIGAVNRVLCPGCQLDTMLVFEGAQGAGKSTSLRTLVPDGFFSDSWLDITNKDALLIIAGCWIYEFSELGGWDNWDADRIKGFISRREDKFRPPYGKTTKTLSRHCVFVGTTNRDEYLLDDTGNRRFWPVATGQVDLEGLKRDRDQLWAEAVARATEPYWLNSGELIGLAEQHTNRRMVSTPETDTVAAWLDSCADLGAYTPQELAWEALAEPPSRWLQLWKRIGRTMRLLGYERTMRGVRVYFKRRGTLPTEAQVLAAEARRQRAIQDSKNGGAFVRHEAGLRESGAVVKN